MNQQQILETILTAEVMLLARAIKQDKKNVTTTSDCVDEAITRITSEKSRIFGILSAKP